MVIALRAQQSIQKHRPPPGFLTKIIGTAIGKELALINPLLRYSSKYFRSTQSLFWDILYKGPNPGYFPSSSTILWLYSRCSTSLSAFFRENTSRLLQWHTSTFIVGLVYFFSTKAFLISAIITAKIVYLGFLVSHTNRVAPIIQISKVLSELGLSLVSYIVSYSGLSSVLGTKLVSDLDSGSLSILFIVEYQFFQYFYILSLSFCLVWGIAVKVSLYSHILFPGSQWTLVEILDQ